MKKLNSDILTTENTEIYFNENYKYAPNDFHIRNVHNDEILALIHFQDKPVTEGLNGIFMEDLLGICLHRLEEFQKTKFNCIFNEKAIAGLKDTIAALRERTNDRKLREVQGTYKK
jgi:hypothetical protein